MVRQTLVVGCKERDMKAQDWMIADANEAVADVAHRVNEVIAIYPITPASPMGESVDEWAARGRVNLWGRVPDVVELQSEAGAIASVHGALQTGSLATTFTASQGLLLMIPNLYKIAGELTPFAFHVAARSVATHALSIFGDHSDVMACRQTGVAMLASESVQEAHDMAIVAQAATLQSRLPVMHFFDGFRTSHEVNRFARLDDATLRAMLDEELIEAHRERALSPDQPRIRGTAQNPDVFFQGREASNSYYDACPGIVQATLDRFGELTGRWYSNFEYVGDPEATRVVVAMGSGCATIGATVRQLNDAGERVGMLKVRLYRPFDVAALVAALPESVESIAVLDRTKEPGAVGEPLRQDVTTALVEAMEAEVFAGPLPAIVGGRYGLSSKEFTPAMVKAVFDELAKDKPRPRFTVGIRDDVTNLSLEVDGAFRLDSSGMQQAVFIGLGADGTVGANKNSIKIIGENTDQDVQGYFVYDSKKSGAMTVSHLRFGQGFVAAPYLIEEADFVGCHQFQFVEKEDVLKYARPGAVFLLNAPYGPEEVWQHLPREMQAQIIDKGLRFYVIDAYTVAGEAGMGRRINTVMQTCFFAISGVLPVDEAIGYIKAAIDKTYGKKGQELVRRNYAAVDGALAHLHEVTVPEAADGELQRQPFVPAAAPDFVQKLTQAIMAGHGDSLPVSAFPVDGTWPTGTTQWERRGIAQEIPVWDEKLCIQCNKCALVCPHAAIRTAVFEESALADGPASFKAVDYKAPDLRGLKYTVQVAPDDCTGCQLCVNVCPAKDKSNPRHKAIDMAPRLEHVEVERERFDHFLTLPEPDRHRIKRIDAKGSQLMLPLMEYSGACSGCGETPYIKLMTQLFGDRAIIANATGCSSIYGGNLPTTPYCTNADGHGPSWSNSLFENNAEFGFGMRLGSDYLAHRAAALLHQLAGELDGELVAALVDGGFDPVRDAGERRARIAALKQQLSRIDKPEAAMLSLLADHLLPRSIWLVGGDGWAYDIGYGGLDHVLSQQRNVNVLVLDTEVYSNTGGQASKATPLAASAKFATAGKMTGKKDLGLMAMSYGHVYVASVAFGANDNHAVKALQEAEAYAGPSLVIAYSHCIAHGYDLAHGLDQQTRAVDSGVWPLYRFDPRRIEAGEPPLVLDSKPPKLSVDEYMREETRFRMVERVDPERYRELARQATLLAGRRRRLYEQVADIAMSGQENGQAGNGKAEDATTPSGSA